MDTSKIKNILIIVLLVLNGFFLGALVVDSAELNRSREETRTQLLEVLESQGVTASEDIDFFAGAPSACELARSSEAEEKKVKALLGGVSVEDLGGNIYFYHSDQGQASFRGTGELDLIITGGTDYAGSRPERSAVKMLEKADIHVDEASAVVTTEGDNSRVELCCTLNGYPVYNAVLSLDYGGGRLQMISGTRVFDTVEAESGEKSMDCVSAVMRFLELMKSDGLICSRLESIRAGYIMNVEVSGESTLTPVWQIVTDTGTFHINALTGKMEAV